MSKRFQVKLVYKTFDDDEQSDIIFNTFETHKEIKCFMYKKDAIKYMEINRVVYNGYIFEIIENKLIEIDCECEEDRIHRDNPILKKILKEKYLNGWNDCKKYILETIKGIEK